MTSNATSCSAWRLYAIIDRAAAGAADLVTLAQAAIRGGADVVQLRDKAASAERLTREAEQLLAITRPSGIPLIINDRPDVARTVGAEGVHLGQDDLPLQDARILLGPGRMIGKSTHSLAQAVAAMQEGADYIGIGPVYPTPTKPAYGSIGLELVTQVAACATVPFVCIGGIDVARVVEVLQAGGRCIAVVRAICGAADPEQAARLLKQTVSQFLHTAPTRSL